MNLKKKEFFLVYINHRPAFGLNPADLNQAFGVLSDELNSNNNQPQISRENLLYLLQQFGEHMNDYEMADCLANLLNLNNESTELFDTMNAEDACMFNYCCYFCLEFHFFHLGQFIENQLPEQVTLQTFMEDLLKMPSQYVDQVMYSIREQQHRSSLHPTREQNRHVSIEQQPQQQQQQQQQRLRSSMTATTQSTTSASNES